MEVKELKNLLFEFGESVKFEHDLKKKNWFNIGGKSKVFFKAENLKELVNFIKILKGIKKIPKFIIRFLKKGKYKFFK